ncbi:MAG TPA: recombinase family protein [Fimbriimonas sp.]|nr:recombinase family protein [Fimbriimonas sp.]
MQAYIYIRFSTPKQEKGASKERQLEDCQAFCARRQWPIADTIQDLGRSAWTGAHLTAGNLGKFAERVRAGEVPPGSVLVVEKLDRLSRQDPRTTQRWMEDLCAKGLSIATVSGDRVYDDAGLRTDLMGTFEILMRAKLAHDESTQKSERVLDRIGRNIQRAKETGRVITAKAPGWLVARKDRSGFDPIPERVAVVTLIYELAAEGKGARWIAKELNERGIPAWGRWRRPNSTPTWEITSVALILKQPSVEGDYVPGFSNTSANRTKFKERLVGYYPRIVDADLVARARAAVASRKTGGGRHTKNVANLFAGIVVCGACGHKMNVRTNGEANPKRYWQCVYSTRSRGCEQREMFRYEPFEAAALDAVLHLALDDRFFSSPDRTGQLANQVAEIAKAISDRKEQAENLLALLARKHSPERESALDAVEGELRGLEVDHERVAKELALARGSVSPTEHLRRVRDVRDELNDQDRETRRTARLKVQTAFRELGCRVVCEVDENGTRQIGLFLRGGAASFLFDNQGTPLLSLNLVEFLDHLEGVVDLDTPEGLADAAARLKGVMPAAPGDLDASFLSTMVRRHRANRELA